MTSTKGRVSKGENPIVVIKDGPGGCSWRQGSVGEREAQVSVVCPSRWCLAIPDIVGKIDTSVGIELDMLKSERS